MCIYIYIYVSLYIYIYRERDTFIIIIIIIINLSPKASVIARAAIDVAAAASLAEDPELRSPELGAQGLRAKYDISNDNDNNDEKT